MILAGLLSLVFLALPAFAPSLGAGLGDVPRTAAVLLPLLFAAGLPAARHARGSWLERCVALSVAAPLLAFAARIDAARGDLDATGLAAGAAMLFLLAVSAGGDERGARARAEVRAVAWVAVVVLGPLLALAYTWGTRQPAGPAWVEAWRGLSPLAWAWDRAALVPRSPWAPLGASATLGALALFASPGERASRAGSSEVAP